MNDLVAQFILPSPRRLQPWEKEYFRHLEAEWNVLNVATEDPDSARIKALIARFEDKETRPEVHRNHLLEFEQTLMKHRSLVSLVQIAPVLRQRFHDVVGDRVFAAYRPTEVPDCTKDDPVARKVLYDDLATVLGAIHWRYNLFPFSSQIRTTLTLQALVGILFYTVVWIAAIVLTNRFEMPFVGMLVTCIFAGMMGGFVSALRRLQTIGDDTDSVFLLQGIRSARFWLWFSPILGSVFAVIALLFFMSGFLGGSVFPTFPSPAQSPFSLPAGGHAEWFFWRGLLPTGHENFAKLFVWCFISGFAERLIPDMIDNLITKADVSRTSASPSTPVPVKDTKSSNEGQQQPGGQVSVSQVGSPGLPLAVQNKQVSAEDPVAAAEEVVAT